MGEDEKTKLRRNLVVFCAAYLACAYLEIPIQQIFSQSIFSKVDIAISGYKWLVLSSLVYGYLTIRWFSSEEQRNQFGALIADFKGRFESLYFEAIKHSVKRQDFGGWLDFTSAEDRKTFKTWIQEGEVSYPSFDLIGGVTNYNKTSPFCMSVTLSFEMVVPDRPRSTVLTLRLLAELPLLKRVLHSWRAANFVSARWAFWEWAPPFVLALICGFVIIFRWAWILFFKA